MELKCFRTLWGVTTPWPQTLDELQRVGCCGIEARVPLTVAERRQLADRLQASGLEYIAILFSGGGCSPPSMKRPSSIWRACSPASPRPAASTRALSICSRATIAGRWRSKSIFSARRMSWPPGLV